MIGAPLTREERRRALIDAIASRPAPWIVRELAESLARSEYGAGRYDAIRLTRVDARAAWLEWEARERLGAHHGA